jgi:hypothetical protein
VTLRCAASFRPGPTAKSLRDFFKNERWLAAHTRTLQSIGVAAENVCLSGEDRKWPVDSQNGAFDPKRTSGRSGASTHCLVVRAEGAMRWRRACALPGYGHATTVHPWRCYQEPHRNHRFRSSFHNNDELVSAIIARQPYGVMIRKRLAMSRAIVL